MQLNPDRVFLEPLKDEIYFFRVIDAKIKFKAGVVSVDHHTFIQKSAKILSLGNDPRKTQRAIVFSGNGFYEIQSYRSIYITSHEVKTTLSKSLLEGLDKLTLNRSNHACILYN